MQVVINDILINYQVFGSSKNPAVVILHGWGRHCGDWTAFAKRLSFKYYVVLPDLPGHGGSTMPPFQPFDTYDYAHIVEDFINKLLPNKITLIGHSFGGKIATVVASESKKIEKLFLVDASEIDEKNRLTQLQIFFYKRIKIFLRLLPKRVFDNIHNRIYKKAGNLVESFKRIVVQDVDQEAQKIKVQTIIVWGDLDKEVTTYQAKRFRELISGSILRIVWGTGHHPHLEKPEKFYAIMDEYLS